MRILITGFTPFNNESINPSWEIAQSVHAPEGVELVRLQIPTEFSKGAQKVIEKIEEVHPNAVLSLGQFGGSACFNVEYVGINCRAARIPDNSGYKPWYEPVVQDGDVAYKATLPVVNIVDALNKAKLPASVSFSAGAYVCNDVLYNVCHYCQTKKLTIKSGFIHVPYLPEQILDKPTTSSMSLADMLRGIEVALQVIADDCK
ncbi:pyroglutamyl-peptidase I [Gardnerella sp. Marseille-Q9185]|uniref:pyroglutamyl-peptidase I n=1 Tax=Gardnerella TaxID=2701 RepID=UPI003970491D